MTKKELFKCKTLYNELYQKNKHDLEMMSLLEETITQIKFRTKVSLYDIKLSEVRGYIYIRSPWFKRDSKVKDIRTVVGKVSDHKGNLKDLTEDLPFVLLAKTKMIDVMTKKINVNLEEISKLKKK